MALTKEGASLTTSVVRRFIVLQLQHHDKASLLSGKLHAILQRPYPKGRDLYDLLWYLSDPTWPEPNLVMLNNALAQTNWQGGLVVKDNWKELVRTRLRSLDWNTVVNDVRPFVEPGFCPQIIVFDKPGKVITGVNPASEANNVEYEPLATHRPFVVCNR